MSYLGKGPGTGGLRLLLLPAEGLKHLPLPHGSLPRQLSGELLKGRRAGDKGNPGRIGKEGGKGEA